MRYPNFSSFAITALVSISLPAFSALKTKSSKSVLLDKHFQNNQNELIKDIKPFVETQPVRRVHKPKVSLNGCTDFGVGESDPSQIEVFGVCVYTLSGWMRREVFSVEVALTGTEKKPNFKFKKPISHGNFVP